MARRAVAGVAYMYWTEVQSQDLGFKQFADANGLPAPRFYNLSCMAYGAAQKLFDDVVRKGYLPKSRAEGYADEYKQVDYAMRRLILPYIDQAFRKKETEETARICELDPICRG